MFPSKAEKKAHLEACLKAEHTDAVNEWGEYEREGEGADNE